MAERDRATVVCCDYVQKVHHAAVGSCYTSGRPCTKHVYVARSVFFEREVHLYLTGKGALLPNNQCWCQKTRVNALSCGIIISAVHHLVLSQYMRLTDRQNCDQQYHALHYMQSDSKNDSVIHTWTQPVRKNPWRVQDILSPLCHTAPNSSNGTCQWSQQMPTLETDALSLSTVWPK